MRWLIESLIDDHPIYWRWIGGIFVFYVAVMISAAFLFMAHQSGKKPAQQSAAQGFAVQGSAVTVGGKLRSVATASMPFGLAATHP